MATRPREAVKRHTSVDLRSRPGLDTPCAVILRGSVIKGLHRERESIYICVCVCTAHPTQTISVRNQQRTPSIYPFTEVPSVVMHQQWRNKTHAVNIWSDERLSPQPSPDLAAPPRLFHRHGQEMDRKATSNPLSLIAMWPPRNGESIIFPFN